MSGIPFKLLRTAVAAAALFAAGGAYASVETYTPGSKNDPRLRSAAFLGEDKRHLSALSELLQAQSSGNVPADYRWTLAENYLSFGLHDRAAALYTELSANVGEEDEEKLNRGWLRLAEFEYQRGYLPEARATLMRIQEGLPKALLVQWQDQLSRVLMTQGKWGEAVDVLMGPKNTGKHTPYMQYNLGIALINDGRLEQGRSVLDRVDDEITDRDTLVLADRANMTLGWHFLQDEQGATARPRFAQVRVEGPYANRALLGLGWAEMAPDGRGQSRADTGESSNPFSGFSTLGVLLRRGLSDVASSPLRAFRRTSGTAEEEDSLHRALPAWLELIERDPQDPAVQEGWLAIPYALDQLGAHEQARHYYEQAVERLEAARLRTDAAIKGLRSNRMIETIVKRDLDAESGWNWELKDLPDAPETYYLQTLIAEHRFAEALKNYRDVRLLSRNLDAWEKRLGETEKAYSSNSRQTIDPRLLFDRAKERAPEPERVPLKIKLASEINLAEPGRYRKPISQAPLPPPRLRLAEMPKQFLGTFEQIGGLRKRLNNLRPALIKAGDAQARYLQRVALQELDAQKKLIEKYLVEARFALARQYDRQSSSSDPDEYEIKK